MLHSLPSITANKLIKSCVFLLILVPVGARLRKYKNMQIILYIGNKQELFNSGY